MALLQGCLVKVYEFAHGVLRSGRVVHSPDDWWTLVIAYVDEVVWIKRNYSSGAEVMEPEDSWG